MYWIYIALAVLAVIGVIVWRTSGSGSDGVATFIFGMIPAALVVVMANGICAGHGPVTWKDAGSVNIRALSDGQSTHGSFFLGSGTISSSPVYFYYYEVGPSQYKQSWVYADSATIVEKSDATPHLEIYKGKFQHSNWSLWNSKEPVNDVYDFVVPNGTVVPQYVLDTSAR